MRQENSSEINNFKMRDDGVVASDVSPRTSHYGKKPGHFETSKIHFPTCEPVSEVSERANE